MRKPKPGPRPPLCPADHREEQNSLKQTETHLITTRKRQAELPNTTQQNVSHHKPPADLPQILSTANQHYSCHICTTKGTNNLVHFENVDDFQQHLISAQHKLVVQKNDKLFYCSLCKKLFGHDVNNWVRHLTCSKVHTQKLWNAGGGKK